MDSPFDGLEMYQLAPYFGQTNDYLNEFMKLPINLDVVHTTFIGEVSSQVYSYFRK